jgi:hypothetical protein
MRRKCKHADPSRVHREYRRALWRRDRINRRIARILAQLNGKGITDEHTNSGK